MATELLLLWSGDLWLALRVLGLRSLIGNCHANHLLLLVAREFLLRYFGALRGGHGLRQICLGASKIALWHTYELALL